jgi:dTDP-4-amino-4,6-dideoxygalactose transaminase
MRLPGLPGLDPYNFPQQEAWRYRRALRRAQNRIVASGQVILGPGVAAFEAAFAAWIDPALAPESAVGVANGTDALELALRAAGVGPGDAVALPSHTAYATLAAVLRLGGRPLFIDLAPERPVLCPEALEQAIASHPGSVRAVIAVHLYGEACDLGRLSALCERQGIPLIEDCAQACGTRYAGQPVGRHGRFACFSFYPTKNLAACGDGGAVVARRADDAVHLRRLRFYGWDASRQAVQFGVNSRLDELQAWLLAAKLNDLERRIAQRRQVAAWYCEELADLPELRLPGDGEPWRHSYHLYVVQLPPALRDRALAACRAQDIPVGLHYPMACHQHAYAAERFGSRWSLPHTEALLPRILSLPLHPYLPRRQVRQVARALRGALVEGP